MAWRMPSETARHDRTWMAFPRAGQTLGDTDAEQEECYAAWTAIAHAVARFEPVTMVVDPSELARARRMLSGDVEIVEAPLDEFWMRDFGPTFVLDDERPGVLGAVDWIFNGWGAPAWAEWALSAEIGRFVAARVGAELVSSVLVNEGGGIHVDGEGTVLLTETVQLDPRRNPYADRARGRGRARPHDRHDQGDLAAARPDPRLRRLRHERARRHRRDDPLAGPHPAAPPGRRRPPRPRCHEPAARPSRSRDGCRRPRVGCHRRARSGDAARRRGLRRLELRQPPRRQRRRDRVRLRRRPGGCRGPRHPVGGVPRARSAERRRPADLRPRRRHPLHHPAAAGGADRRRDDRCGGDRHRRPAQRARDAARRPASSWSQAYLARIDAYDAPETETALNAVVVRNPDALAEARSVRCAARGRTHARARSTASRTPPRTATWCAGLTAAAGSPAFAAPGRPARRLHDRAAARGRCDLPRADQHAARWPTAACSAGCTAAPRARTTPTTSTAPFASGSSNGSGTATAASFAAFGLGEETWSSGRGPASNNGAVRLHAVARGHLGARQLAARAHDGRRRAAHPHHGRPARGARRHRRRRPRDARRLLARRSRGCRSRRASAVRPRVVPGPGPAIAADPTGVLAGRRIGVPRMYINADPDAGTADRPGIGGPTGQRIETRASVIALWEAARRTSKRAGATVVEVDFPVVSNYEGDRPGAPTIAHPRPRLARVPAHARSSTCRPGRGTTSCARTAIPRCPTSPTSTARGSSRTPRVRCPTGTPASTTTSPTTRRTCASTPSPR